MSWLDAPALDPEPVTHDWIVLDASVVIGFLDVDDAHAITAYETLNADEWIEFMMHPHTLAEALVGAARRGMIDEAVAGLARVGVERWHPDQDAPRRIASLRATTRLALADCCPLDVAEQLGARLATFDDRLARVARERGIEVVGID